MKNIEELVSAIYQDSRGGWLVRRGGWVLAVLLLMLGLAGVTVWPVVFQLCAREEMLQQMPVLSSIRWAGMALAGGCLVFSLAVPERLYRFSKELLICFILSTLVFFVVQLVQPIAWPTDAVVALPTLFGVLSFTMAMYLAFVPALLGAGLAWLIRTVWVAIFRS